MLNGPLPGLHLDLMSDVFPGRRELDAILDNLPSVPLDASLAIIDSLVPPASMWKPDYGKNPAFDMVGFSQYARIVSALVGHLSLARHAAKENMWALRHLLAFALYANEWLDVPYAPSPIFWSRASKAVLRELTGKVEQLTTYLLSSVQEEGWHAPVVNAILTNTPEALDSVGRVVYELVDHGKRNDTVRESRILHTVLQHVLGIATKEEADQWILLARKIEKQGEKHYSVLVFVSG